MSKSFIASLFTSKEDERKQKEFDEIVKYWEAMQSKAFQLYPVCSVFDYLGVKCTVVGYVKYVPGLYTHRFSRSATHPKIEVNYVDDNGAIISVSFSCAFLLDLAESKRLEHE